MDPERWRQIEECFHRIADAPAGQRAAELAALHPEIRREVELLLAGDGLGQDTILSAVEGGRQLLEDGPEQRFGPWASVGRISQGGMGVVYRGVRADRAFEKQVAIKVLHMALDTPWARERFYQERQILAALEHPNIARLLDGGETQSGVPYIVLDYIDGEDIIAYAESRKLSVTQRLRLFLPVCDAVQFAHASLVVHRDLKPGNILVTREGIPKLLDFGIARLLEDSADRTRTLVPALTPQYASPEQLQGGLITTASDVYSLGMVLYELMSGQPPYRVETGSLAEMVQVVCHTEPARPGISEDLDNILLMALRKEPSRRYASVRQFAEDIERSLTHRTVLARPVTAWYRSAKFMRRNRAVLAAVAAVVLSLTAGLAIALREARVAEERFQEVRRLARTFVFDVHDEIAKVPGTTKAREMVVATAVDYLDRLARHAGNDAGLLSELGSAYQKIGDVLGSTGASNLGRPNDALQNYAKGISVLKRAAALDPRNGAAVANCYAVMARVQLGQGQVAALDSLRQATALIDRLVEKDPGSEDLAISGARIWRSLGIYYEDRSDTAAALAAYVHAKGLLAGLDKPGANSEVKYRAGLLEEDVGDQVSASGDFAGALAAYQRSSALIEEALRMRPDSTPYRRARQTLYERLAEVYFEPVYMGLNDAARALPYRQKQVAEFEQLHQVDPNDSEAELGLAIALFGASRAFAWQSPALGVETAQRSVRMFDELIRRNPNNKLVQSRRARALLALADVSLQAGNAAAAQKHSAEAVTTFRAVLSEPPDDCRGRASLIRGLASSAKALTALGKTAAAEKDLREAVVAGEPITRAKSPEISVLNSIAWAYEDLGAHLAAHGGRDEAGEAYRKAIAVWAGWNHPSAFVDRRRQEAEAALRRLPALHAGIERH